MDLHHVEWKALYQRAQISCLLFGSIETAVSPFSGLNVTNNPHRAACAITHPTTFSKMKEMCIMLDTRSSPENITLSPTGRTIADEYLLSTLYANHLCVKSCLIVVAW